MHASTFRLTLVAAALLAAVAAPAQTLPPPDTTDPVALGTMQGFPPAPDKTVRLGTLLKYPNARWGMHHIRELGPTAAVWRGEGVASKLPAAARALDAIQFDDADGHRTSIADWQRNTYTDGLIVLKQGKVVYEQMYAGMLAREPHALWSLSKSFTGLLAASLIAEGRLDPNALVSSYLPELKDSAWADATLQQTLDMTTGVQYTEDFRDPNSGISQYLYAAGMLAPPAGYTGPRTIPEYLKTVKKQGEHGTGFIYKTVDTEVVGWVLSRVTGKSYATLLSERIWAKIGAQEDAYAWADPTGTQLASIGLNATLRDLGRVGEMLRLDGRYNGQQVLPAGTVAGIRKGGDPEKFKAANMPMRAGYSYHDHFWIPHDAAGTFEMKGLFGQHVHVNPAAGVVIVKLSSHPVGDTRFTHTLDRAAYAAIAAALK
jgi:CubicO group peptidase (beta-lactamase class C family)